MNADTLNALADRVEKLTEWSYEIDDEIALAVGYQRTDINENRPGRSPDICWSSPSGVSCGGYPPFFTRSLDAAMTLVPDECGRPSATRVERTRNVGCSALVWVNSEFNRTVRGDATSPALALTAAALRARAAVEGA